jgi:probable DNA metabolism protein
VLVHDGSFPGLLCAVAENLNLLMLGRPAMPVRCAQEGAGLFETARPVQRDDERARLVWQRLSRRIGTAFMQTILEACCSDYRPAMAAAATVLVAAWRHGAAVLDALGNPNALAVEKAAVRTRAEAHLHLGLTRFSELVDGSWYAAIHPDCDILMLLGDHFSSRFPDMTWVIHDQRRGTALLHQPGSPWRISAGFKMVQPDKQPAPHSALPPRDTAAPVSGIPPDSGLSPVPGVPPISGIPEVSATPEISRIPLEAGTIRSGIASLWSPAELAIRATWQRYFGAVTITERRNPALQANHLPLKYRDLLPEMDRLS